jgi:hypothetical protein
MTDAVRVYLKLNVISLIAVGLGVLSTYWPGGLISMLVVLASFVVVAYVVFTGWGFGKLGRRLSAMNAADAEAAREEFFRRYPWLRRERQQANSALLTDTSTSPLRAQLGAAKRER